jgi:hypothetical protein
VLAAARPEREMKDLPFYKEAVAMPENHVPDDALRSLAGRY